MKAPNEMTIAEWQEAINAYRKAPERVCPKNYGNEPPIAMRIENTQLSIARHYGGMTLQGYAYTYFEPPTGGRNEDGSPEVAWLVVRDDLLRWLDEKRKGERKEAAREAEEKQGRLL